jgi:hypothetical protein
MSGQWPPEWDDQEEEFPAEADQVDTPVLAGEGEARLSEVAAYLASVPVPVLPDAVEARINAALAAETASAPHALGPAPARARVRRPKLGQDGLRRSRGGRLQRGFPRWFAAGSGSLVVCLLLAGLGLALAHGSSPTYSQSAPAAAPAEGAASSAASSGIGSNASSSGLAPLPRATALGPQRSSSVSFRVTASGTKYEPGTLAAQVRAGTTSSTTLGTAPSAALRGCVLQLTGGLPPRLVDRATYQGEPAYVIASSTRVWVVGLGCTAAKTELIVSVALAGLPGNLRALVSVEQ